MTNPTQNWTAAEWQVALAVYHQLPDTATIAECRSAIDAALTEHRNTSAPPPSCNGLCVRNRDRGFLDPYDVTVGDRIIQPDPNCPVHSAGPVT